MQFARKYKHNQKMFVSPFKDEPHVARIFTDGSCTNHGYKNANGGYAAIIVSGYYKNNMIFGRVNPVMLSTSITLSNRIISPTNIRSEGLAILTALNELYNNSEWSEAIIYSDSDFWVRMINKWMPRWTFDTFITKSNPDISMSIYTMWERINKDKKVSIEHVHNTENRGDFADLYAGYSFHHNDLANTLASIAKELADYDLQKMMIC
jgi:ribonuclease HI